jgi:hypothetical protein
MRQLLSLICIATAVHVSLVKVETRRAQEQKPVFIQQRGECRQTVNGENTAKSACTIMARCQIEPQPDNTSPEYCHIRAMDFDSPNSSVTGQGPTGANQVVRFRRTADKLTLDDQYFVEASGTGSLTDSELTATLTFDNRKLPGGKLVVMTVSVKLKKQ